MPYCKALYNHMFMSVEGKFGPCCVYDRQTQQPKEKIHQRYTSPSEYINSDEMKTVRKNMEKGWDPGCNKCETLEKLNLPSWRTKIENYCESKTPVLEFIDISFSNKCNLRCRMCGAHSSSKWAETLGIRSEPLQDFKKYLESIDPSNIRVVKYIGGEPFITPEIKILFEWMQNLPQKVKFFCNTNLTFFPEKYVDILKSFDEVMLGYSIDGVGLVNDYIRQDSSWSTVEKNLKLWEDFKKECNVSSYVHTVTQAYNFHNLIEIKKQVVDKFKLPHSKFFIWDPQEFTLHALPPEYIKKHTNKYNIDLVKRYEFNINLYLKLKSTTYYQDHLLNTNIKDYIPELSEWI